MLKAIVAAASAGLAAAWEVPDTPHMHGPFGMKFE